MTGAGLGLRRSLIEKIRGAPEGSFDFLEVAPENWIGTAGARAKAFAALAENYPVVLHGLSLNLGGSAPLNVGLVERVKAFKKRFNCPLYSEHLTACGDHGQLYDLMPIPFTESAVKWVSARIRQVQDLLGERIAIENGSYYLAPGQEMQELDFVSAVLEESDCDLLLDINNIFVNSINHGYDPLDYLNGVPAHRVRYFHLAGHVERAADLRIDTHGAEVAEQVWGLLEKAFARFGSRPVLLERDNSFPHFDELIGEVARIRDYQQRFSVN